MAVIRKSITFTEKLNEWVQMIIAQGEYANESEYIRDLIRHDRAKKAKYMALQSAIQEGLDSGVSENSFMDIWEEAENKYKKRNAKD